MRILVEPSGYPSPLRNVAELAMQQTALARLAKRWPGSRIDVLTDSPEQFPFYADNVKPLSTLGRRLWLFGMLRNRRVPERLQRIEGNLLRANPEVRRFLSNFRLRALPSRLAREVESFIESTRNADVLVVCGMGGVADVFDLYALDLLDTIELVKQNGKSIVLMFGQAFGPIAEDGALFKSARAIMPTVDLVGLRESRASAPLLRKLGVDPSHIVLTGDDALEVAVHNRSADLGAGIAVNVRVAPYSEVTLKHVEQLAVSIQRFASSKSIPLVPLPCSAYVEEEDAAFIRIIVGESPNIAYPGNVTPESMIARLHQCRIAVSGSYHAAIFALAQGVPVIGLYRSAYYRDKFMGLAHLFGSGVAPLDLTEPDWPAILESRILDVWNNAPVLRPQLLSVAEEHLRKGRNAFQDACRMVENRFLCNEALFS